MNTAGLVRHYALAALLSLGLAACGGSGGSGSSAGGTIGTGCVPGDAASASNCGSVIVALTDADGDFTSYTVDVLSIALERLDGTKLEVLPQAVRVDFAQLSDLSELIGAATVAPGVFVGGSVRIDYSNAEIYVEAGGDIVPIRVYDNANRLLTGASANAVVDMAISLPATDRLVVTRGGTALLSIDFDLAASHSVDTANATAVASPYLVAEVRPVDHKELRVRGALVDVDLDAGTYDIRLRPWHHRAGDFGVFTVLTTNSTVFEIDEISYTGAAGLRALAAKPAGTLTVAFGTLNLNNRRFTAEIVDAGESVAGGRYSAVMGNIISRAGDRLVMRGVIAIRRDRPAHFHRTVVVEIGADTKVSRVGDPDGNYDKDDLSVGQRTIVFGQFLNPAIDNTDRFGPDIALVLDATQGRARMLVTHLLGNLRENGPNRIVIGLRAIDRLSAAMFDFTGTGMSSAYDADPTNYEIATATLPLDALEFDRPVRVLGFVTPFGEAPPDFEGRSLIGPRDLPATLGIAWGSQGTTAPFSALDPTGLVLDPNNPAIGLRHHMLIGDRLIDLYDLPSWPRIEPSSNPRVFGIWEPGHIELFNDFGDFVDELAARLGALDRARSLAAYGRYAAGDSALSASKIVVHMLPATAP